MFPHSIDTPHNGAHRDANEVGIVQVLEYEISDCAISVSEVGQCDVPSFSVQLLLRRVESQGHGVDGVVGEGDVVVRYVVVITQRM